MILGVGVGLFILAFLWVIAIGAVILLSRLDGSASFGGVAIVLIVLLVTLILWYIPRGSDSSENPDIIYDSTYITRILIICICGIVLMLTSLIALVTHTFEVQHAKSLLKKSIGRYVDM